jgi:hypothetical protein
MNEENSMRLIKVLCACGAVALCPLLICCGVTNGALAYVTTVLD